MQSTKYGDCMVYTLIWWYTIHTHSQKRAHIVSQCITTQFTTNIKVSVKMLLVIQSKRHIHKVSACHHFVVLSKISTFRLVRWFGEPTASPIHILLLSVFLRLFSRSVHPVCECACFLLLARSFVRSFIYWKCTAQHGCELVALLWLTPRVSDYFYSWWKILLMPTKILPTSTRPIVTDFILFIYLFSFHSFVCRFSLLSARTHTMLSRLKRSARWGSRLGVCGCVSVWIVYVVCDGMYVPACLPWRSLHSDPSLEIRVVYRKL